MYIVVFEVVPYSIFGNHHTGDIRDYIWMDGVVYRDAGLRAVEC